MQDLKVSLIQTHQFWEDKAANLSHFEELLTHVPEETELIVLPEMFHTGFSMNANKLAEEMDGMGVNWLKKQAQNKNAACVASLIIKENDNFFNRLVFVRPNGDINYYDKRKLFGLAKEEMTYHPGEEKKIITYKGWKILLQVCYDLRFPEIQRNRVVNDNFDYDLLINIANWPEKRNHHWKTLIQARAIENQAYLIAVNRVGTGNGLDYSGDSAVITPLGIPLGQEAGKEKVIQETLAVDLLFEVRKKMPFLKDRG